MAIIEKIKEQLPTNIQIVQDNKLPTISFIFYLQEIQKVVDSVGDALQALQDELDATQAGAGLDEDGNYITPIGSNYLGSASSLYNADAYLDNAIWTYTRELITEVSTTPTALSEASQSVLVDATAGDIDVTLPNPANCFSTNRSFVVGITKIDVTANVVNILPFASELIVGETSQYLVFDGEVLNFITDGTNWYLRS